jgi:hypothetical protein
MLRLEGKAKFDRPRCRDCAHFRQPLAKRRKVPYLVQRHYCSVYSRDVPASGLLYPVWCRDRFEPACLRSEKDAKGVKR